MIFHETIQCLIFFQKFGKLSQNLSSAAVVLGALRVKSLTLCMLGNLSCFCCCLLTFFKFFFTINSFKSTIKVSNGLDTDLIWVQTVCQGYQQMIKAAASKERINVSNKRKDSMSQEMLNISYSYLVSCVPDCWNMSSSTDSVGVSATMASVATDDDPVSTVRLN